MFLGTSHETEMTLGAILESALYCTDLDTAETFYREVLGLEQIAHQPGRHVFFRCGQSVVLLFDPAATTAPVTVNGARVPSHGARGAGHLAFRVEPSELADWRQRLTDRGVSVESEIDWPGGGRSIYFRDPSGNSLELATAAVWGL